MYKVFSPSFVNKRVAEFKRGHTNLEIDPHIGRPKTVTTPEIIQKVHKKVLDDQQLKVDKTAETLGISKGQLGYILHEELKMKTL